MACRIKKRTITFIPKGEARPVTKRIIPKVAFKSVITATQVVYGGENYVDWFPYRITEKRALSFFTDGLPFTALDKDSKKQIENIILIRHAIAHNSKHAIIKFEKEVIGTLNLQSWERKPHGFLRSNFRINPTQTRYENIANETIDIARKLC